MGASEESQPCPGQLADLSALADGTLDPRRRLEIETEILASPKLTALYARERRVVELLQRARSAEHATARLRSRIEAQRPTRNENAWRGTAYAGALAAALCAAALLVALALHGGSPGSPSVSQAAALALRGPARPAPSPDSSDWTRLRRRVEGMYFPNWSVGLGWRAVGQRADRLAGRPAVTVYYGLREERVAYTIVGVPALAQPAGAITNLSGIWLRTLALNGRTVVTWRRDGHTCVLSAVGVPALTLRTLAVWNAPAVSTGRLLGVGPLRHFVRLQRLRDSLASTAKASRDRRLPDPQRTGRLRVGQADYIDRHQCISEDLGQSRNRRIQLRRVDPRFGQSGGSVSKEIEIIGQRHGQRPPRRRTALADKRVVQDPQQISEVII
jgi:hypothetical protein